MTVRILCLLILLLELRGLSLSIGGRHRAVLVFYTQLSNMCTALSALLTILFGQIPATVLIRYLSSCMLAMTFFVTTCVLIPMGGDVKLLLFSGSGLYHHLVIPLVSVGSYLLAEQHVRSGAAVLLPTALTFLYGMVMLWLNARGMVDGPYPFFRVKHQSVPVTVLWMAALTCVIGMISLAVFALGR